MYDAQFSFVTIYIVGKCMMPSVLQICSDLKSCVVYSSIHTLKTVDMIVDFRRDPPALPPLTIMNSTVTAVESFRFLGTTISQDLKWDNHIDIVKKAQ